MKMFMNTLIVVVLAAIVLGISPGASIANELVLNPNKITGQVILQGYTPEKTQIEAFSGANYGVVTTTTSSYDLTVGVPVGGSLVYNLRPHIYLNIYNRVWLQRHNVTVNDGQVLQYNIDINPSVISGSVTVTGMDLLYGYVLVDRLDSQNRRTRASQFRFSQDGIWSIPVDEEGDVVVHGYAVGPGNQVYWFDPMTINVTRGQETVQAIALDVSVADPASLSGNITLNGADVYYHYMYLTSSNGIRKADLTMGNGPYEFAGLEPGSWTFKPYIFSYLNWDGKRADDFLRYPYPRYNLGFDLAAGENRVHDIVVDTAQVNGKINVGGSRSWNDINTVTYYANGVPGTDTAGGHAWDRVGPDGSYDLIVSDGDWWTYQTNVHFFKNDAETYFNQWLYLRDYSDTAYLTMTPGQVINGRDINVETGTVTLRLSVADGTPVSNTQVSFWCYAQPDWNTKRWGYQWGNAYGRPNVSTVTADVSVAAAAPSNCRMRAYANVNGSKVYFGEITVDILPGTDILIDLDGPQLLIDAPSAEQYVSGDTVIVSGMVTDDNGIESVTVNGQVAALVSTANATDPNEVSFEVSVPVSGGPNSIATVATDVSGKTASDTRTVYKDVAAPVINWSPADGSIVSSAGITVSGITSDDNLITRISVNETDLSITSASEVSFSLPLTLVEGVNQITVVAYDNAKRSTTQTHTINYVTNRPPLADAGVDQSVECQGAVTVATLDGSGSSDPDGDVLQYTWSGNNLLYSGNPLNLDLVLGQYNFVLTAADAIGATSTDSVSVSINDTVAPVVNAGVDVSLEAEGPSGAAHSFAPTISETCDPAPTVTKPADNSVYPLGVSTVTITATDASNNTGSDSVLVNVLDTTPPTVVAPASIDVLATYPLTAVDLGMATAADLVSTGLSATASDMGPFSLGSHAVTWSATDAAGNIGSAVQTVVVRNEAPVFGAYVNTAQINEGDNFSVSLGFSDANDTSFTGSVSYGDGSIETLSIGADKSVALSHGFIDNGEYAVVVTVTDAFGASATATINVSVANVAPVISAVNVPVTVSAIGTAVNASVSYSDAGVNDTHVVSFDWGENEVVSAVAADITESSDGTGNHIYTNAGVYTVAITVTDKDGAVASTEYQYVVVYDPSAGFVTGGGWITSPAGAYVADPAASGKASFGFNAKYKKGANTPDGNTQFQFKAGDLNFSSDLYEWLVVAGARAQFKGEGTVNGIAGFGFMLTAIDGEVNGGGGVDKFRMKIWNITSGAVIYDNQLGIADDGDITTTLTKGSIVIHN